MVRSSFPGSSIRQHRLTLAALSALALAGLSGCAQVPAALDVVAGVTEAIRKPAEAPGAGPGVPPELRPLFQKGTVNGADLYDTLKQVRTDLQAKRSARSWAQSSMLMDTAVDRVSSGSGGLSDVLDAARNSLVDTAVNELKQRSTTIAYQALDEHLSVLLGTQLSTALAAESIALPSGRSLNAAQSRRVVTMATLVVAARLSGRVLEEAEKDFKSLEVDYKSLLEKRERAAELLFKVVDQRRAAQRAGNVADRRVAETDMRRSLSDADLKFIDSALNTMNLTEFSQDMAAQNLALQYLRQQDPKAFGDYSTQSADVVRRTNAYLRSVAGVAAFASLLTNFVQSVGEIAAEKNYNNIWASMPLIYEFAVSAVPVVQKTGQVAVSGVGFPSALQRRHLFSVSVDGTAKDVRNTKEVFEAIQGSGATDVFSGILFRDDAQGWLNGVRRCDAAEAGRMLDATLSRSERGEFASKYFGDDSWGLLNEYAFINAFTVPTLGERERRLPDELLGRNHRRTFTGLGGQHLAELQERVSRGYGAWSNQQVLRLIFANREGAASYATMDLGRISVRPTPSPEAVFVYESYINACVARTASPPDAAPGARPSSAPATTNRTRPTVRPQAAPRGQPAAR